MKALTLEILFKGFDRVKEAKGNAVALNFLKACLNERDDTAAISYMWRNLFEVVKC